MEKSNSKKSLRNCSSEANFKPMFPELQESDNAGGCSVNIESPENKRKPVNFEEEFEKIMEEHMDNKYKTTYNIKDKYIPQIIELEESLAELAVLVVENFISLSILDHSLTSGLASPSFIRLI